VGGGTGRGCAARGGSPAAARPAALVLASRAGGALPLPALGPCGARCRRRRLAAARRRAGRLVFFYRRLLPPSAIAASGSGQVDERELTW
jgi:hypothetical protein